MLSLLLQQGISEPEFYGDLVYRFRKFVCKSNFSEQFRKLTNRYKRIGYSLDIMRQTSCIVVKKGKRKVQGVPQSQTAAPPRPQEEEETDKSKQAQIEQTYEKH